MEQRTDATHALVQGFAALVFLLLIAVQAVGGNPFPWSDEWGLVPPAIGVRPLSWTWLWQQHVDHRLPVQKLLQVLLLRASVLDFRVLVFANAALAFLAARFLLASIRSYRGRSEAGDLLVPLILLNPGFTPFVWGFQFQFLSSVLSSVCILALLLRDARLERHASLALCTLFASILAFCGMNGALSAAVASIAIVLFVNRTGSFATDPEVRARTFWHALPLLAALGVFFAWTPSSVSGWNGDRESRSLGGMVEILLQLIHPRSGAQPPVDPALLIAFDWILYAAAILLLIGRICHARKQRQAIDAGVFGMALVLSTAGLVLASVSVGRAGPWSPGVHLHYGYLASLLPLVCWIVVSTQAPRTCAVVASLVLLPLYGGIYAKDLGLRREHFAQRRNDIVRIGADLDSGMSVRDFVVRNNRLFSHIDDERSRRSVESAVSMLREAGVAPWASLTP